MPFIEKDLLIGRVQYLEKINSKPGQAGVSKELISKVIELVQDGSLITFMQVEAVFNHLLEKANDKPDKLEESATDILEFLN